MLQQELLVLVVALGVAVMEDNLQVLEHRGKEMLVELPLVVEIKDQVVVAVLVVLVEAILMVVLEVLVLKFLQRSKTHCLLQVIQQTHNHIKEGVV
jgi:hypothetical protein